MDPEPLARSITPTVSPKHPSTAQSSFRDETSTKSDESTCYSLDATSSPPPVQVMERPEDFEFEHGRIPSSVFDDRLSSSMEWSFGSNDSLFSIRMTTTYTQDQANLLTAGIFKSEELVDCDEVGTFRPSLRTSSSPVGRENDRNSLEVETPDKLDVPKSVLDEPQKVVRWKTQVEHHADEELQVRSEGKRWESSPLTNHKPSEFSSNQATSHSKKKSCWSFCCFGSFNQPKWSCWKGCSSFCCCGSSNQLKRSCWNGCWKPMSCFNFKSKRVCCSSHCMESCGPTSVAPEKPGKKPPKEAFKARCCFGRHVTCCTGSWSWSCHWC